MDVPSIAPEDLFAPEPCYALRVRSNFEKRVFAHLTARGYAPFLPVYRSKRFWSDRVKEIDLPLFPGYVFCRFPLQSRLPVISTPGVIMIAGAGRTPVAVDDQELAAVRRVIDSGWPAQQWPFLQFGDHVIIDRGSLQGIEGILLSTRKGCRLVISVSILQRSVAVEIDRDWVRPVSEFRRGPTDSQAKARAVSE